jgi:hypothetical protein
MDAHAAQLRRQMDETRAAMDATLTQLARRVSQMPAALLEQHVLGPSGALSSARPRPDRSGRCSILPPWPPSSWAWGVARGRPEARGGNQS